MRGIILGMYVVGLNTRIDVMTGKGDINNAAEEDITTFVLPNEEAVGLSKGDEVEILLSIKKPEALKI